MPLDDLQDVVDQLPRMSRDGQMARHALATRQTAPATSVLAGAQRGYARGGQVFGALGRAA
jgi:hypothetical protein